jgi:hypothetical protein
VAITGKSEVKSGMDALGVSQYRSYLLRIWKVRNDHTTWRASLERVGSSERHSFASLQALYEYLIEITQNPPGAEEGSMDEEEHETEEKNSNL